MITKFLRDLCRHPWGVLRNSIEDMMSRKKITALMATHASAAPIVVVDVGASGGVPPLWQWFIRKYSLKVLQFDLAEEWLPGEGLEKNVALYQFALGDRIVEKAPVHITKHPGCTSLLKPNDAVLERFEISDWCHVVRTGTVDLTTYEAVAEKEKLPPPTFLKIDVQGFERKVLEGMGSHLDQIAACELEVHMEPMYEGESSFEEINRYLAGRGFMLADLQAQGPFGGEAFEFNAFWIRRSAMGDPKIRPLVEAWRILNGVYTPVSFQAASQSAERSHGFNH